MKLSVKTKPVRTSSGKGPGKKALESAIKKYLAEKQQKRNQPPTDEKLSEIWPAWNACPTELPESRIPILTGNLFRREFETIFNRLRLEGIISKPFDADEYHSTLHAALDWTRLVKYAKSTIQLHQELVERQWAFEDADDQAYGRIAMFRAVKELEVTNLGLLEYASPKLEHIQLLGERYLAYFEARQHAYEQLDLLLYQMPGIRQGRPVHYLRMALGVPKPPRDVPRHLYIARLDALGICSERRLQDFFKEDLPKLNRRKRQAFYRMSLLPKFGKDPYAALRLWIADNVPVFKRFDWRWPHIHTRAGELKLLDPTKHKTHESLMKWASKHGLTWEMRRGVGPPWKEHEQMISRSTPLLSPRPIFGEILSSVQ